MYIYIKNLGEKTTKYSMSIFLIVFGIFNFAHLYFLIVFHQTWINR